MRNEGSVGSAATDAPTSSPLLDVALDRVRPLAERLLREAPVSGGVIAIAAGGARAELSFGTRGPGGAAVAPGDRFEIGSISKTVAGLAAARLEVEGAWQLDTPARELLPWLPLPEGAGEPSLRHLLSHTAGWIAGNSASPGEIGQALSLAGSRAVTAPGEAFHYSNVGFVVLGLAIARATGRLFPAYLHEALLRPLGLPGALPSITGAERAALCPGTVPLRDDAPWRPGDPLSQQNWVEPAGADGNVAASAGELLRFGQALTESGAPGAPGTSGAFAAEAAWLPSAVSAIGTPTAPDGEDILRVGPHLAVESSRYGLGVNVEGTPLGTLLTHGGGMIGYGAFLISHAEAGVTAAVTLSCPGERPYAELLARAGHAAVLDALGCAAAPGAASGQASVHDAVLLPGLADPVAALQGERAPLIAGDAAHTALAGHYRSYTPWCPHYEVGVSTEGETAGHLVLRAYGGVEASTEDVALVSLAAECGAESGAAAGSDAVDPRFRVGADPRLPERAQFRDFIDGVAQTLDIDGCHYSRVVDR